MNELVIAAGLPSAVIGLGVWWIQHQIQKREEEDKAERKARQKEADDRERNRQSFELAIIKILDANYELSKATAKAVQRIPDAHCNGDMDGAIRNAGKKMDELKEFLRDQAVNNLN